MASAEVWMMFVVLGLFVAVLAVGPSLPVLHGVTLFLGGAAVFAWFGIEPRGALLHRGWERTHKGSSRREGSWSDGHGT